MVMIRVVAKVGVYIMVRVSIRFMVKVMIRVMAKVGVYIVVRVSINWFMVKVKLELFLGSRVKIMISIYIMLRLKVG
jgi:hypothetical protein